MKKNIDDIDVFGDDIIESAPSPEAKHILLVNEGSPPLDEEHRDRFHSTAAIFCI